MVKWQLKSCLKQAGFTRFLAPPQADFTRFPDPSKRSISSDLEGLRDCHIENDWVLFYFYTTTGELVLTLTDTGTHSDLF